MHSSSFQFDEEHHHHHGTWDVGRGTWDGMGCGGVARGWISRDKFLH